jgi:hypothetical protein
MIRTLRIKRIGRLMIAAALVGTLMATAGPSTAHAASSQRMLLDGPFYLINANGKYLGADGTWLHLYSNGGGNRYFNTVPDRGYVTFEHNDSKKNIGTVYNGTSSGTRVFLANPSGSGTQDWSAVPFGGGTEFFALQNLSAVGKCMGISGGSSGNDIAIFPCDRAPNQQWRLQRVPR